MAQPSPSISAPEWLQDIVLPLVTPFKDDVLDLDAAQRLAAHYRDAGISALVLFGSTGEGNLIAPGEKARMFQAVREAVDLPLVIGAGGVDTREVGAALKRFDRLDPAGYLIPPPYYLRPSQEGILWHYRELAGMTGSPIILYDIAPRTGVGMTIETLESLFAIPHVVAVKACHRGLLEVLAQRQGIPGVCGDDVSLLAHLERGGMGAISAAAHVRPDLFVALARLIRMGLHPQACDLFKQLKPVVRLLYAEPNPAPIKKYLCQQGWLRDELRRPMTPASLELGLRLRRATDRLPAAVKASG
jgi:4-hydroxy-tetrahydrodipicolinate synthase